MNSSTSDRTTWMAGAALAAVVATGYLAFDAWLQRPAADSHAVLLVASLPATNPAPSAASNQTDVALSPIGPAARADTTDDVFAAHGATTALPDARFAPDSERWQDFDKLSVIGGHLALDGNARILVENLLQTLSRDELAQNLPVIEEALTRRHGVTAAREFTALVNTYGDYVEAMSARSASDNHSGVDSGYAGEARRFREQTQDAFFGAEAAASLFLVERQVLATMEKHIAQYGSSPAGLTEADLERMQQDYAAMLPPQAP